MHPFILPRYGNPAQQGGFRGVFFRWVGGLAAPAQAEPEARRGTGGWGAGLNARRRQRDYTARKLSDLDPPPKPIIAKQSVTTPATVLVPLVDDGSAEYERVLQALIWLDESGLLDE